MYLHTLFVIMTSSISFLFDSENVICTVINFHSSNSSSGIICLSLFSFKFSMVLMIKVLGKPADKNI